MPSDNAASRHVYGYRNRECEKCGSRNQAIIERAPGFWQKECLKCGSTGPFRAVGVQLGSA